jgi:hypothetical protein
MRGARLVLNPEGFRQRERLFAYRTGNTLLMINLKLQQHFGLRAEQYQVFMLIVLSTVQRLARDTEADEALLTRSPLPSEATGSISRRRIAETLGIPLETVRRTVAGLIERGMVVERRRGCLSTPGGTLESLAEAALPERVARLFLAECNAMVRFGAAHPAEAE